MKERSLVFFTLLMQSSVGLCLGLIIQGKGEFVMIPANPGFFQVGWLLAFLLALTGLTSSFFHLKTPLHAWRALSNLKTSWLSREILFATIYTISTFSIALLQHIPETNHFTNSIKWLALVSGLLMSFCMGSAYRLRTVKFWDSGQTIMAFYSSAIVLGIVLFELLSFAMIHDSGECYFTINYSGGILAILLLVNLYFSFQGFKRMISDINGVPGNIRKMLNFRVTIGILAVTFTFIQYFTGLYDSAILIVPVVLSAFLSEFLGRVLFYAAQLASGVYLLNE